MNSGRNILIYYAVIYNGDYDAVLQAAVKKEHPDEKEVERVVKALKCKVVTMLDEDYPLYLKRSLRAPIVLFYYGDISLIDDYHHKYNLGVVGTRKSTEYGLTHTERIVKDLAKDCTIVSGMALGIDTRAHESAIKYGAKTVAVLGSGIDHPYPYENINLYKNIIKHGGLVVSEYPGNFSPLMENFPARNRLIALFSNAILVTEAYNYKTGTAITVRLANEYRRQVMAIPYPLEATNSFCNQLIYEGFKMVRDAHDVLIEMNLKEIKII